MQSETKNTSVCYERGAWLTVIDVDKFSGSGDLGKVNLCSHAMPNRVETDGENVSIPSM